MARDSAVSFLHNPNSVRHEFCWWVIGGPGTLEGRFSQVFPLGQEIPMGFCVPAPVIAQQTLQGFRSFRLLGPRFDPLHRVGPARDRAGHRPLFYEPYGTWPRADFFNPAVTR